MTLKQEKRFIKELVKRGWVSHLDKFVSPYTLIEYTLEQACRIEYL